MTRVQFLLLFHCFPATLTAKERVISRQAYAGLLWSKQFYHYVVQDWLEGDPEAPNPPSSRYSGRNAAEWKHLFNRDVISMPDKWEYPWVSFLSTTTHQTESPLLLSSSSSLSFNLILLFLLLFQIGLS